MAFLLNGDTLTVKNNFAFNNTISFYLRFQTLGRMSLYKQVVVTAFKEQIVINKAPQFSESLKSQQIRVVEAEQESGL